MLEVRTVWGSPGHRRRRLQRLIRRSNRAMAAGRLRTALRTNLLAEETVRLLEEEEGSDPYHLRVLAALLYNRAGIYELVGGSDALRTARLAASLYHRLDPTKGQPSKIAEVLAPVQVPVVVTDYRTVRAVVEEHQRVEREVEESIARAADASLRAKRLDCQLYAAVFHSDRKQFEDTIARFRAEADRVLKVYQELGFVGHHHTPDDLRRVEAECRAALTYMRSQATWHRSSR